MKVLSFILCFLFSCFLFASQAIAKPVQIKKPEDINFGDIYFFPNQNGTVSIGTNSNVIYSLGFSSAGGTPQAGYVEIQGDEGLAVNVFCSQSAVISTGSSTLTLENIEVSPIIEGTGNYGSRYLCQGLSSPAMSFTLRKNSADNTIYIGGQINVNALTEEGIYSTSSTGGTSFMMSVDYQ